MWSLNFAFYFLSHLPSFWREVFTGKQTIRFFIPSFLQPGVAPKVILIGATAASVALLPDNAITEGLDHAH